MAIPVGATLKSAVCKLKFSNNDLAGLKDVALAGKYTISQLPQIDLKNSSSTKTVYYKELNLAFNLSYFVKKMQSSTLVSATISNLTLSRAIPYQVTVTPYSKMNSGTSDKGYVAYFPENSVGANKNASVNKSYSTSWATQTDTFKIWLEVEFKAQVDGVETSIKKTIDIYSGKITETDGGVCYSGNSPICTSANVCTCNTQAACTCDTHVECTCNTQKSCTCDSQTACDCDTKTEEIKTCTCNTQTACTCDTKTEETKTEETKTEETKTEETKTEETKTETISDTKEDWTTCSKNSNYDIAHSAEGTIIYSSTDKGGHAITSTEITTAKAKESCKNAEAGCTNNTYTGSCIASVKRKYCESNYASGNDYDGGDSDGCSSDASTGCKTGNCNQPCTAQGCICNTNTCQPNLNGCGCNTHKEDGCSCNKNECPCNTNVCGINYA